MATSRRRQQTTPRGRQTTARSSRIIESQPSSAEWTPEQVRQGLVQCKREAAKALRASGITVANALNRIGILYARGQLIVWNWRSQQLPPPKSVRPLLVILELARYGREKLGDGALRDATRALMDARTLLAVAPYLAGQAQGGRERAKQRRNEADRHRRRAAEIRERRNLSVRSLAKLIAEECNRAGRPCKSDTIERHHLSKVAH